MTLPLRRFEGIVYRAHNPRWAFAPESGDGAKLHGGRFNRPGVAALYTALTLETAWTEAQQGFAFKAQPMRMCAYRVDCAAVIDLCDDAVRAATDVSPGELGCAWEALAAQRVDVPSWRVAERLAEAGASAAIVPSFARGVAAGDRNLVFWDWSRDGVCAVRVIDDFGRLG